VNRASLIAAALPSMLGLLATPRRGDLYSLFFKVKGAPGDSFISQTGFHSVVAKSDLDALKQAVAIVKGVRPKWHRSGMKLLDFRLVRAASNATDSPK
jgi:hypothetical protein